LGKNDITHAQADINGMPHDQKVNNAEDLTNLSANTELHAVNYDCKVFYSTGFRFIFSQPFPTLKQQI
jgi:hypothetical protein